MKIPGTIKAQLPPWNSLEGIEDSRKMCQAKLITLSGRGTLYLLEALYCKGGFIFLVVLCQNNEWSFGAWTESEIDSFIEEFILDPYFKPCLLGELTEAFNQRSC